MGEEGSGTCGRAVSQRAAGICVAVESVRPVAVMGPERVGPAAWLLMSSSYAAVMMGRSGLLITPTRAWRDSEAGQPLR